MRANAEGKIIVAIDALLNKQTAADEIRRCLLWRCLAFIDGR
jgi:hypothetical protein